MDDCDYEVEEAGENRRRFKEAWHWCKVLAWMSLLAGGIYVLIRECCR